MRCRFPKRQVCANFPEVSLQLLYPSEWRWSQTVFSFALRALSFLKCDQYCMLSGMQGIVVRQDASRIYSDTFALVLALCKRRLKQFHIAFGRASFLRVWLLQGKSFF